MTFWKSLFVIPLAILSGCTLVAPKYSFSPENVQMIKGNPGEKVKMGLFTLKQGDADVNKLSFRGSTLVSPYNTYQDYLRSAIEQELTEANRVSPTAGTEISGFLILNRMDANGLSVGEGELTAEIVVSRDGKSRYDKTHTASITWESAFAGAVALPAAVNQYPVLVQKFVRTLFADPDFITAIK